jgi:two-component system, LytTR family, sensor kinase
VFRYFLQGNRTMIPLSEELRIVEAYLEIEASRLGDRLETTLEASDSAKTTLIPVLSIQPLVENAVKHGIAPKPRGGRVSLKATQTATGIRIVIEDTGRGFDQTRATAHNGTGTGLANVRKRLALCYGSTATLNVESSESGTRVSFTVPAEPAAPKIIQRLAMEA